MQLPSTAPSASEPSLAGLPTSPATAAPAACACPPDAPAAGAAVASSAAASAVGGSPSRLCAASWLLTVQPSRCRRPCTASGPSAATISQDSRNNQNTSSSCTRLAPDARLGGNPSACGACGIPGKQQRNSVLRRMTAYGHSYMHVCIRTHAQHLSHRIGCACLQLLCPRPPPPTHTP